MSPYKTKKMLLNTCDSMTADIERMPKIYNLIGSFLLSKKALMQAIESGINDNAIDSPNALRIYVSVK